MRVSEETVNVVLAEMLFERVSHWFKDLLPEAFTSWRGRRARPDIILGEIYGVKVAVEAKLGYSRIHDAVKQCRARVEEGLADICFAVAYSDKVRRARSIEEVRSALSGMKLRIKILSPTGKEFDLGFVGLDELISLLDKHGIYHEVVEREIVEEIAGELKRVLDTVDMLPPDVLRSIAGLVEKEFDVHGGVPDYEEEGEEE